MNNTVTGRTRKSRFPARWLGMGAIALAVGIVWLSVDISAQQTPAHTPRKAAPRYVRHGQATTPTALTTLLRQATLAVNARDADALKPLVAPEALSSFGWMREKTTKHWTGEVLALPDPGARFARNASAYAPASSALLYLAIFHAWHTCESDGDHIHRIEPTENGGWKLGAEIPETETGGYRVRDHDLTVTIDPARHTAAIRDTIRVEASGTPLLPVCLLRLSDDFRVSSLTGKNAPVAYAQAGGVIAVAPPLMDANHAFSLTLTYSGHVLHQGSDYINTQEATLNSYWYPHIARLPATSTVTATAPAHWTPIAQGEKKQEKRNGDGSLTVTYRNDVPNSFFTIDMGPYTPYTRKADGRTLTVYLLTPNPNLAQRSLTLLEKSLAFYDTEFAPFPYTHYEVVETRGPFGGALEAYSFATFGEGTLPSELPHELSHTWWGGLIPCAYTRSMWNEAFAQYSQDLFARLNPQLADEIDVDKQRPAGKRRGFGNAFEGATMENAHDTSDNAQNAVGYSKGAFVLRVLEEQIGREKMRDSIRNFLAAHPKGEAAEWPEFERAVNQTTGQDYGWFFEQWTKRTGLPHIRFANVTRRRSENGYVVEGDIDQGEPYRLRVPLRLQTGNEKPLNENLDIAGKQTHFQLNTPNQPIRLTLDPENILPLATTAEQASVGF